MKSWIEHRQTIKGLHRQLSELRQECDAWEDKAEHLEDECARLRSIVISQEQEQAEERKPTPLEQRAEEMVVNVQYGRAGTVSTWCLITLENGFEVIGHSACADPEAFDRDTGEACAFTDAMAKVLSYVAFLYREDVFREQCEVAMAEDWAAVAGAADPTPFQVTVDDEGTAVGFGRQEDAPDEPTPPGPWPLYRSHKLVRAMAITALWRDGDGRVMEIRLADGGVIKVGPEDTQLHKARVEGYLVRYLDGYLSYSPAEAFEKGNKPA